MKHTPRQELIADAASRARNGCSAHMALEAVISECRQYPAGTLGAAMLAYYRNVSENGLERLIKAVESGHGKS